MKFSKTRDLMDAWRNVVANPGNGEAIFRSLVGNPGGATNPPTTTKPATKPAPSKHKNLRLDIAEKLERLRLIDADAASEIDRLIETGAVSKDGE